MNNYDEISFVVNNQFVCLPEIPGEMLSDLLRYRLGLMGTKIGCNEEECGACTVVIDGEAILSCNYPAKKVNGKHVKTIEGLSSLNDKGNMKLHPLQEAFVAFGAVQCGFCIPGQIMTSYALLESNPEPSVEEIKYALKDTLCRCAGYPSIIGAIQSASENIRMNKEIQSPSIQIARSAGRIVGQKHFRPDSIAKVTGKAIYTDDLQFENMAFARVKRAMVPSAIITKIDISKALDLEGVLSVLTAKDLKAEKKHGLVIKDWPVMVDVGERVRYVGDAIAIVAAESENIALDAINLIKVEFQNLPVVTNPVDARDENSEQIHSDGNLLKHIKVRKGDVEKGFSESEIILEQTYHTNPNDHAFLEPECSIARITADGRVEIFVGSQIPYADREQVASVLGIEENKVRIIGQLIGGGFGGKEDIAGQIHAALLSKTIGRPVKLLFDRQESLIVHPKRHATQIKVKIGAKNSGELISAQTELYGDSGAYASLGEKVMTRATTHSSGPYEIENVKADCYAMYTNNPPAGAFRGFGVLQSAFAVESIMDSLAHELKLDPIEIRKKNALHVGSVTNTGQILNESVGLLECIEKVEKTLYERTGNNPFNPIHYPERPGIIGAWGFAVAYKNTGLGGGAPDKAGAEIELLNNGTFEVRCASAELGQGLPTVLQMIAAEELGQNLDSILVIQPDTDVTPDGGPTTASRQTFVAGNAVRYAAKLLKELLVSELAERYDVSPEKINFIEGLAQIDKQEISLSQLSKILNAEHIPPKINYTYWAPDTQPLGSGGNMHVAFSFAAQAALVEVNCNTGQISVPEVIVANDVGFAINPLGLKGQVEGGIIMGIGHALTEEFVMENGQVITDRLSSYRIPSISYTPKITSFLVEHPSKNGPFGAKGVGEIVLIPTIPAIANGLFNAIGMRINSLPINQEKVLQFLLKKNL